MYRAPPGYCVNLTIFFLYNYFQTCEWRWLKISKDWSSVTNSYDLLLSIIKYFLVSLKLKGPLCKQHCDRRQQGQPKAKLFKLIFLTSFPIFGTPLYFSFPSEVQILPQTFCLLLLHAAAEEESNVL